MILGWVLTVLEVGELGAGRVDLGLQGMGQTLPVSRKGAPARAREPKGERRAAELEGELEWERGSLLGRRLAVGQRLAS